MTRKLDNENIVSQRGEFLFYQTEDGRTRRECRVEDETLWLSQATISEHLKNIFTDGELVPNSVCANFAHTAADENSGDMCG